MLTVLAFSNMFSIGSISPMFFIVYGLKRTDLIYKCSFILMHRHGIINPYITSAIGGKLCGTHTLTILVPFSP
jgi:hypothetical protein